MIEVTYAYYTLLLALATSKTDDLEAKINKLRLDDPRSH